MLCSICSSGTARPTAHAFCGSCRPAGPSCPSAGAGQVDDHRLHVLRSTIRCWCLLHVRPSVRQFRFPGPDGLPRALNSIHRSRPRRAEKPVYQHWQNQHNAYSGFFGTRIPENYPLWDGPIKDPAGSNRRFWAPKPTADDLLRAPKSPARTQEVPASVVRRQDG